MREIICRFSNQSDVDSLGIGLARNVSAYCLDSHEVVDYSTSSTPKLAQDKHDCSIHYRGMPEFKSKKIEPHQTVVFRTEKSSEELSTFFKQSITDKTKSIWYPEKEEGPKSNFVVVGDSRGNRYPIYVISKNRSSTCGTSKSLSQMAVPHYVVVEPDEIEDYKNHLDLEFASILPLDMSFKDRYDTFSDIGRENGTGPGPARNFAWEHSIGLGAKRHWVMDDNANEGFFWLYQNYKIKMRTGGFLLAMEDFVDRYDNIAIAGMNYSKFCKENDKVPAYVQNTRIYSFLLIDNDLDMRWRGRYNEDTDLSLRVLKRGLCTVQFNVFLAGKVTTQRMSGGNTEEFYNKEGTRNKSDMLKQMHPDVTEVVWKFNRWHHQVDYSGFNQRLSPIIDIENLTEIDNYGMEMVEVHGPDLSLRKTKLVEEYREFFSGPELPTFNEYRKKTNFFK